MTTYQLTPAQYIGALEVLNYGLWSATSNVAPADTAADWLQGFDSPPICPDWVNP